MSDAIKKVGIKKVENAAVAGDEPKTRPTIGIAFGGGGIRGFAHMAILEKFKEYGIKADMVSGTSIGSGVAAMCAAGRYGEEASRQLLDLDIRKMFAMGSRGGFISGKKYAKTIVDFIGVKRFEDLPISVKIVSVDLVRWQKVIFSKGSLQTAIQASSALPGAFSPISYGDKLLVDGGIIDNCPADILRRAGADIVIAIDLDYLNYDRPKNVVEVVQRAIDIAVSNNRRPQNADIVIKPFEKYVAALAINKAEVCYTCGKECIERDMPQVLDTLCRWYEEHNLPCPEEWSADRAQEQAE